jgi:ATP-dependent DNA helicase RecG
MHSPLELHTPVTDLYKYGLAHLGQTSARKLALGLTSFAGKKSAAEATVEDLLSYLPMRYEDRSHPARIRDLQSGMEASLELYVQRSIAFSIASRRAYGRSRLFIFEITAIDPEQSGKPVVIKWFVSGSHAYDIVEYYKKKLRPGTRFITFGRWEWDASRAAFSLKLGKPADELELLPDTTAQHSEVEVSDSESDPRLAGIHVGRVVPVYRKLGDLNSKRLREIIYAVLDALPDTAISETLPSELRRRQRLIGRARALREIHFPNDSAKLSDYERARSPAHLRLIFEDFFWLSFGLVLKRGKRVREKKGACIKISPDLKKSVASVLPFKLTKAQRRVVAEIFNDMQSEAPMNRLLQGDVGSGKTIVALIAMMAAVHNGYQAALMAPTEILAEQHARNVKRLLAKTPYRIELLTGSQRASEKRRLQTDLAAGEINACIGTHALIQESIAFEKLGLVVIDEQHRFGVMQRAELRDRGFNPDVLVMTATPIPRSLAMTLYGDLDVSVINEMPPGRTPIETQVFGEDHRQEVKKLITREVLEGHQVYVVYPLVAESEKLDLKDATRRYEYLRDTVFPKFSVGLLHGKMKPAEKDDVMTRFLSGEIQILVSTTVIEVGVDVPNASVMIVEHAERFGLSQLHQLRGRVGRGADKSYCVLLTSDRKTTMAQERLGIMAKTSDGFLIAEKDLELRGPGELMGTRQSGLPEFRVGNLARDLQILEKAKQEAEFYLSKQSKSAETSHMIEHVAKDPRLSLAAVG